MVYYGLYTHRALTIKPFLDYFRKTFIMLYLIKLYLKMSFVSFKKEKKIKNLIWSDKGKMRNRYYIVFL